MTTFQIKQEFIESYNLTGNGYAYETRIIKVTNSTKNICDFFYNEEVSFIKHDNLEFKILRHYKMFGLSDIEIIDQKSDEIKGIVNLPFWNGNDYKEVGKIQYMNVDYNLKRLKERKYCKEFEPESKWDYIVELTGSDTKIIYKLNQELKPFISGNHRKQPFSGEIELKSGDVIALIMGIYLVQIFLNNLDLAGI